MLAAYAGIADDYDLYTVVDFYERQRAFERVCAAVPLARDAAAIEAVRERAAREERKYSQLARAIDRPALLPRTVVAMTGLVASGKSTVATALADRMGVPRIVADTTRQALAGRGSAPADDLSARLRSLSREFDGRVYAEALRCTEVAGQRCRDCVTVGRTAHPLVCLRRRGHAVGASPGSGCIGSHCCRAASFATH